MGWRFSLLRHCLATDTILHPVCPQANKEDPHKGPPSCLGPTHNPPHLHPRGQHQHVIVDAVPIIQQHQPLLLVQRHQPPIHQRHPGTQPQLGDHGPREGAGHAAHAHAARRQQQQVGQGCGAVEQQGLQGGQGGLGGARKHHLRQGRGRGGEGAWWGGGGGCERG
jgi:hypothetical protein